MTKRAGTTLFSGLALVAITAVLAAGCGGGGSAEAAGGTSSAPAATSGGAPENAVLAALPSPLELDPETQAYPGPADTFVGEVEGTSFFLGVSIVDGEAAGYVCNGEITEIDFADPEAAEAAFEAASEKAVAPWLTGSVDGDTVTLASEDGSAEFTGTLDGDTLTGTVTLPDGTRHEVSLGKASGTDSDGLYRLVTSAENAKLVGGWVYVDGQIRGTARSFFEDTVGEVGEAIVEGAEFIGDCTRLALNIHRWHMIWENALEKDDVKGAKFGLSIQQERYASFEQMGCPDGLIGFDPEILEDAGELLP